MQRELCRAKIHRAVLNETDIDYEGSLTVPPEIMEAAGIAPWEKVQVANVTNGARLDTYVIPGEEPRLFRLNGAAARLADPGDVILCIFYALFSEEQARTHRPTVVIMNPDNTVKRILGG